MGYQNTKNFYLVHGEGFHLKFLTTDKLRKRAAVKLVLLMQGLELKMQIIYFALQVHISALESSYLLVLVGH